jgi:hypothetical protein
MARFLSPAWFDELPPPPTDPSEADLVVEQVVNGTPDGDVRYQVGVTGAAAYVHHPTRPHDADLTITADWPTAAAIAKGELSTQAALMSGRLRVHGNLAHLAGRAADLVGVDPIPDDVRRRTTY